MNRKQCKKKMCLLALFIVILLLTGCVPSGNVDPLPMEASEKSGVEAASGVHFQHVGIEALSMENGLQIIEELASEKYAGRLSGTEGNRMAVEYIAGYFEEIGLENPEGLNRYRQPYRQKVIINEGTPVIRIEDEQGNVVKAFDFSLDYRIATFYQGVKIKGSATGKLAVISDLNEITSNNENLEERVLLIENAVINDDPAGVYNVLQRVLLMNKGIKGIIVNLDNRRCNDYVVSTSLGYVSNEGADTFDNEDGPIVAYCTDEVFGALKMAASENNHVHMEVNYSYHDAENENVIGVIPGKDEAMTEEYILIGAHLDHVGDNKNGTYQPGAFDNASGTATLMEIARVLKETEAAPKKSIVFIAFNGEEQGIFGSTHYVKHPVYPLENSVLINLDMVGSKNEVPLTIGGGGQVFSHQLYDMARELGIECEVTTETVSDQRPFNQAGVDAVTLIQSDQSKIHTIYDTVENVDLDRMKQVTEFVLYYIDQKAY